MAEVRDAAEGGKVTLEEKAREWLYRGGLHDHGDFHAFIARDPNRLGGIVDLPEILAAFAQQCIDEEREACAKVADGFRMVGASPIGPLHGAGWNDCQSRVATAIRVRGEK